MSRTLLSPSECTSTKHHNAPSERTSSAARSRGVRSDRLRTAQCANASAAWASAPGWALAGATALLAPPPAIASDEPGEGGSCPVAMKRTAQWSAAAASNGGSTSTAKVTWHEETPAPCCCCAVPPLLLASSSCARASWANPFGTYSASPTERRISRAPGSPTSGAARRSKSRGRPPATAGAAATRHRFLPESCSTNTQWSS